MSEQRTEQEVWNSLAEVKDPEIPVLSLTDLRVIKGVRVEGNTVKVSITPTFVGCPALEQMKQDVRERLMKLGFSSVEVETVFSAPWSTEDIPEQARRNLSAFGIAPPPRKEATLSATLQLPVACPHCGSQQTHLESPFGPTLCRQIFYCDHCLQSFERFKPI